MSRKSTKEINTPILCRICLQYFGKGSLTIRCHRSRSYIQQVDTSVHIHTSTYAQTHTDKQNIITN